MADNESDFFREMVGNDVKPIKAEKRANLLKEQRDTLNIPARRAAATAEQVALADTLSGDYIESLDPHAILEFKRPGIQNGVYRNLRLGKYQIDARLDLHRMTVEEARKAVYQFVRDCIEHDIRCVLVTHGKGEGREHPALLKSCVAHWLPQLDAVQAFHSAQKQHGGSGATYVLLRKSERKRQNDLERHQKRRG